VEKVNDRLLAGLKETFSTNRGDRPVHIRIKGRQQAHLMALGDEFRVDASLRLVSELKAMLGTGCLD
jgi:hypothetical protein